MPLNANHPMGIAAPFDGFDDTVGSMSGDTQFFSGTINGLVMAAVDVHCIAAGKLAKEAARFEGGIVLLVALAGAGR